MKILIIGGVQKSLINFRGPLIKRLIDEGHTVFAAANGEDENYSTILQTMGVKYYPIKLQRTGINPFQDIFTFIHIVHLIGKKKPDIILAYTIKPVVYSGLAVYFKGSIKAYALITGLGHAFLQTNSLKEKIVSLIALTLYRVSLFRYTCVIFQNPDDQRFFESGKLLLHGRSNVIAGSGVDLDFFREEPLPDECVCLLIGRLLKEKGIREYVKAARIIKESKKPIRFKLVGGFDSNPSSISQKELEKWVNEGIIEYGGLLSDVRPVLKECRVYVLPSYREGTPRTVLEAMATGRPIITTDVPGCRETIDMGICHTNDKLKIGRNGILVPKMDPESLVLAIKYMFHNPLKVVAMSSESRRYVELRYDVNKVNNDLFRIIGVEK